MGGWVDLDMRNYFIDCISLWFPIPNDEVYELEKKVEINQKILELLFNNRLKQKLLNNTRLSINDFFHFQFRDSGLLFQLNGRYFDTM